MQKLRKGKLLAQDHTTLVGGRVRTRTGLRWLLGLPGFLQTHTLGHEVTLQIQTWQKEAAKQAGRVARGSGCAGGCQQV